MADPVFQQCMNTTFGSKPWVVSNLDTLKKPFPDTFCHRDNIDVNPIYEMLCSLGIDCDSQEKLEAVITIMFRLRLIIEDRNNNYLIKWNPRFDPKDKV